MTTPLTPARLSEIRARAEAATPGPWDAEDLPMTEVEPCPRHDDGNYGIQFCGCKTDAQKESIAEDAAFIAAARQDVPDLLDELESALASERAKTAAAEATIARVLVIAETYEYTRLAVVLSAAPTAAFDAALAEARAEAMDEAFEIMRHLVGYRNAIELKNRAAEIREAQK